MDHSSGFSDFRRIETFSLRVRELSKALKRFCTPGLIQRSIRKRVIGALLVLSGLVLAAWAHQFTGTRALADWKKLHPPSETLWNATLKSKGFERIEDSSKVHQALRLLPITLDAEQSIWLSEDGSWVARLRAIDTEPTLHARAHGKTPQKWVSVGSSWDGFESLFDQFEKLERAQPFGENQPRSHKKIGQPASRITRDPCELRY